MRTIVALVFVWIAAAAFAGPVESARGVLERTVPGLASRFDLRLIPKQGELDVYEIRADSGKANVAGSSGVAIARGAYELLKASGFMASWEGNSPEPERIVDFAPLRVVCPNRYRHYYNVCTFGYTTPWWDWARWRREIDWMALHGFNMPLAMNGQEIVWQRVFLDLGVPQASIDRFFSGPAYLPWHRMGNLDGHMGPLPKSWLEGQVELQKQILAAERELGMTPVVPGFSGFVPVDFDQFVPNVRLDSPTAWGGFAPTRFIDVRDPMFVEVGRRFVEAYRHIFGSDHLYLCDTFNEQDPKYPESTKLADLKAAGAAVYDSIRKGDPDGIWVMQGWLFFNSRQYWGEPEVSALLSGVPDDRMIILDLGADAHEVWRDHPSVARKGFIYNTLHNFGQNTALGGALQATGDRALQALADAKPPAKWLGMGLTMEGIDQNPVLYEFAIDAMWTREPMLAQDWLDSYVLSRYGVAGGPAREAWGLLLNNVYSEPGNWIGGAAYRYRPGQRQRIPTRAPSLRKAVELLLSDSNRLARNGLYQRDLVDVTKTWLGDLADLNAYAVVATAQTDLPWRKHAETLSSLLRDLDRLQATRPEHRLSTWVDAARSWGTTPAERDQYQQNAKMQITVWGGTDGLTDYANKEWAGVLGTYTLGRWKLYFDELEKNPTDPATPDWRDFEGRWAMALGDTAEPRPRPAISTVRALFEKYENFPQLLSEVVDLPKFDPGIAVGKPVRDSGGTEGTASPSLVTDGETMGRWWAASPAPQWVEIDLEKETEVTGVRLFPYCGDARVYKYKVELSTDRENWTVVVDGSKNTKHASFLGHLHEFAAKRARYVRVTMLENSANIGVHLYEVQVFGSK